MAKLNIGEKDVVRQRLLEAGASHFARHGYEAANINAIALEAGYAKGTIYNYFASKDKLFLEVLSEACRRTVARYEQLEHGGGSTRTALLALAAADVAVLRDQEPFMRVLVREAMVGRPQTHTAILEHLAPFSEVLAEILARGAGRGEVRDDRPPAQLALLFVGQLSLLYIQHWGSQGGWPTLEEIPDLAVTSFLDGAAPRPQQEKP